MKYRVQRDAEGFKTVEEAVEAGSYRQAASTVMRHDHELELEVRIGDDGRLYSERSQDGFMRGLIRVDALPFEEI